MRKTSLLMSAKMNQLFPEIIFDNDVIVVNGKKLKYVEFNTINTQILSYTAKERLINIFTSAINNFSKELKIRTIRTDYSLEENVYFWEKQLHNDTRNEWEKEYINEIASQYKDIENDDEIIRKKYLLIYAKEKSVKFEKEEEKFLDALNKIGSTEILKEQELKELMYKEYNPFDYYDNNGEKVLDIISDDEENIYQEFDFNMILPSAIKVNTNDIHLGDVCYKIYGISGGKDYIEFSDVFEILQRNKNLEFCLNIGSNSDNVSVYDLKREEDKILADIKFTKKKDDVIEEEELVEKRQEIKEARNEMNKKGLKIKKVNMFFILKTTHGNQQEEYKQARSNFESQGYTTDELMYEQRAAFVESSLFGMEFKEFQNTLIDVTLTTKAISALYPFKKTREYEGTQAMVLGTYLKDVFLYEPTFRNSNRINGNGIILGQSGSGKSTLLKSILVQEKFKKNRIFLIDPEEEFTSFVEKFHGTVIDVDKYKLNILEVRVTDEEQTIESHIGLVNGFLRTLFGDKINENLMSKILLKTYAKKGITEHTSLIKLKKEDYPIFDDVFKEMYIELFDESTFGDYFNGKVEYTNLKYQTNRTYHALYEVENHLMMIENLTSRGVYGKWFNGHSTFDYQSYLADAFCVFNIRKFLESKNERLIAALYFSILTYIEFMVVNYANVNSYVVADEAHLMLRGDNKFVLTYLVEFSKRLRKRNSCLWLVTQDIDDFIKGDGKDYTNKILSNAALKIFMKLDESQIRNLEQVYQSLTQKDKDIIFSSKMGEAILVDGVEKYNIKFQLSKKQIELLKLQQ